MLLGIVHDCYVCLYNIYFLFLNSHVSFETPLHFLRAYLFYCGLIDALLYVQEKPHLFQFVPNSRQVIVGFILLVSCWSY